VTAASSESKLIARIGEGDPSPLYLVTGEALLAEAAGSRIAAALAGASSGEVQVHHHPEGLASILGDLRTYSLFGGAKVVVVVESAVLSDRNNAAYLVDQAAAGVPVKAEDELGQAGRRAAGRLLQACRLFGLEPFGESADRVLGQLPQWAFEGGTGPGPRARKKRRTKKDAKALRDDLVGLLEAAAREGLEGWAESDAADLAAVAAEGLPPGHGLVLCEVAAAADHPLVAQLRAEGNLVELTHVEAGKRGWEGVRPLAAELERETSVSIERDALEELARRTLRKKAAWGDSGVEADSSARFAAEYRKLAALAKDESIRSDLVREVTRDRGDVDVFAILDAIGAGKPEVALHELRRSLDAADDLVEARLRFFGQLAAFCRRLTVISGLVEAGSLPRNESNYQRFRSKLAPQLEMGAVPGRDVRLFSRKMHAFPLHKAYLAARRFSTVEMARLPGRVLDTELQLKGESDDADAALSGLIVWLATAGRGA
jgi:DNA polymerase III delta subunit